MFLGGSTLILIMDESRQTKKRKRTGSSVSEHKNEQICVLHFNDSKSEGFLLFSDLTEPQQRFEKLKTICAKRQSQSIGSPYRMDDTCILLPVDYSEEHGYHRDCYQRFTKNLDRLKETFAQSKPSCSTHMPRRASCESDRVIFKKNCIFCNKEGLKKVKVGGSWTTEPLKQFEFGGGNVVVKAEQRNDEILLTRIRGVDLFAAEAHYHRNCYAVYMKDENTWRSDNIEQKQLQTDMEQAHIHAFSTVCESIDREIIHCQKVMKLSDLCQMYVSTLEKTKFPNPNYRRDNLKKKITSKYGEKLACTKLDGNQFQPYLVYSTALDAASAVKVGYELGNKDLIKEVGCYMHNLIAQAYDTSGDIVWPPTAKYLESIEDIVPHQLQTFMNYVISGKSTNQTPKVNRLVLSISQDICRAATNGSWKLPKHIFMCMTLRHLFRSAQFTTLMNRLGHSESYSFSLELETAIATALQQSSSLLSTQIVQNPNANSVFHSEFDNFDQLVNSLTGSGSIHTAHGIMLQDFGECQETGGTQPEIQTTVKSRKRSLTLPHSETLPDCFVTSRKSPSFDTTRLSCVEGEDAVECTVRKNMLWILARMISGQTDQEVPSLSGFISATGIAPTQLTTIDYYPVINHPITDYKTVQECLRYAEKATQEVGQKYVITTFDLGVCMKAYPITWNSPKRYEKHIILIGTFHLACAYMRMIGVKMEGSGLSDVLMEAGLMSSGSLNGVMSGKHYERAIHCHRVMIECLERLLYKQFLMSKGKESISDLPEPCKKMLNDLVQSTSRETLEACSDNDALNLHMKEYQEYRKEVKDGKLGKTAKFWLSYIDHVWLVLNLLESVKTNNFQLYRQCLHLMCDLFFSYGAQNYARYLTFFSAFMANIEETHPGSSDLLQRGGISVARSFIPGSRCDVDKTMEETFMKAAKSHAGAGGSAAGLSGILTNYDAYQRWVKTTHERSQFFNATLNMADMSPQSNEGQKHRDLRPAEIQRSESSVTNTVEAVKSFLDPFDVDDKDHLYCISSGAPVPVDIEKDILRAETAGQEAKQTFTEKKDKFFEPISRLRLKRFYDMHKTAKVKTKANKVIEYKQQGNIAFRLLVQSQMQGVQLDMKELMTYPLTPVPYSIGTSDGYLAKTDKSKGFTYLTKDREDAVLSDSIPTLTIEDGNASFYCMREIPGNFRMISQKLFDMMPRNSDVLFSTDMYIENSIKSMERKRRGCGEKLIIKGDSTKKPKDWKLFLTNDDNKKQLVQIMCDVWGSDSNAPKVQDRDVIFICEGVAYKFSSADGKVTLKEEIFELRSTQEETDSRVVLYGLYAKKLGYECIKVRSPDSDIFFILLNFALEMDLKVLFDTGAGNKRRLINISEIAENCTKEYCSALLGLHAFTGCDSTSAFKGMGKVKPIKTLQKMPKFGQVLASLGETWIVSDELCAGLEEFTCAMYGSPNTKCVDELRFCKIKGKCENDSLKSIHNIDLGMLPPCKKCLIKHVQRVNYQVCIWKRANVGIPEIPAVGACHGWHINDENLEPLWMDTDSEVLPQTLVDILAEKGHGDPDEEIESELDNVQEPYLEDDSSDID